MPEGYSVSLISSSSSTAAVFAGSGFFHNDRAAVEFLIVQVADGVARLIVVGHFYEAESLGAACEFIHDNLGGIYLSEFFESVLKIGFLGVVVKLCYKNVHKNEIDTCAEAQQM